MVPGRYGRAAEVSRTRFHLASKHRPRTLVGARFPLERAAEAHAAIMARRTPGKRVSET